MSLDESCLIDLLCLFGHATLHGRLHDQMHKLSIHESMEYLIVHSSFASGPFHDLEQNFWDVTLIETFTYSSAKHPYPRVRTVGLVFG